MPLAADKWLPNTTEYIIRPGVSSKAILRLNVMPVHTLPFQPPTSHLLGAHRLPGIIAIHMAYALGMRALLIGDKVVPIQADAST